MCFKNLEDCPFHPIDEKPNTVFVLMPLEQSFKEIYLKGIKGGLPIGWECNRSDERWDIPEAVCKICKSIQEATLIIADVTGRNPNVFLELGLSFGLEKKFILLTQEISDLPFDVRTFNAIEYDPTNLDDLHRKLREAISQLKPIPRLSTKALVFDKNLKNAEEILDYQAPHTEESEPTMEILIGSKNNEQDWLSPSGENKNLLQCAPSFLYREIKGRHDFYEFVPRENRFLRILKNGFIISKFPCAQWYTQKNVQEVLIIYIHEMVQYIAELFLFACRIMKKKEIKDSQRMIIKLLNVRKHSVRLDTNSLGYWDYDFAEYSIVLKADFNPDDDWRHLLDVLIRIYRVICEHATITDIADQTIKAYLRKILRGIHELGTAYPPSGVTALDLNKVFEG